MPVCGSNGHAPVIDAPRASGCDAAVRHELVRRRGDLLARKRIMDNEGLRYSGLPT
jgi:hypothetical protein